MPAKVADASVLGAIIFGEPEATNALTLLGRDDIYVPTLLAYELASIARTKIVRQPNERDLILQALEIGLAMNVRWVDVDHPAVVELALATGLSTYDASYLHLAHTLHTSLVTFDNKLRDAASAT
jgi:predicted nucleic acid-binding protein